MSSVAKVTLVLGGARSGKSRYAESVVTALSPPWTYIATAEGGDDEMVERIARHRARRTPQWRVIEAPHGLVAAIQKSVAMPVLVDCLTIWLSNLMLAEIDIEAETGHLERTLAATSAPIVLVSNEVGSGVVPEHPLGRRFRDAQGLLNQRMAVLADRVVLVVAGLPMVLKGTL